MIFLCVYDQGVPLARLQESAGSSEPLLLAYAKVPKFVARSGFKLTILGKNGSFRNREPTILENSRLGFIESVHEN